MGWIRHESGEKKEEAIFAMAPASAAGDGQVNPNIGRTCGLFR
jgi:hypothetical protein